MSKSEQDLLHQAKPYESNDIRAQEIDYPPIDNVTRWPRWLQRHVFSKLSRPVYVAGSIQYLTGIIRNAWVAGMANLGDAIGAVNPDVLNAGVVGAVNFYDDGNSVDANTIVTDTQNAVASVAASTLTVPAGHAYKLIASGFRNTTRAPSYSFAFTPNGGAAVAMLRTPNLGVQGASIPVFGGGGNGVSVEKLIPGPMWGQPGDVWEVSNDNWVAADVMQHYFVYEDYAL